eukprot:TRINITY_DN25065_c0_g5_i1.p1 TRINITY_DN25065_c0_g5~~TRINITY_DN25065_c0_g5_i1.p1  ORF type:complete len:607 (-),score=120.57 TRINITY_DN25065_c0_g5_i1:75-1835(-)
MASTPPLAGGGARLVGIGAAAAVGLAGLAGAALLARRSRHRWDNRRSTADGLSPLEEEKYRRQTMLRKVGVTGQRSLLDASVLIIGAGGLGCPVSIYLCGVGIGRLGIVDGDIVETTNLHRQVGHKESRLGENKALSLRRTCNDLNGACDIRAYPFRAQSADELARIIREGCYDLVVDCTDCPASRCLVNDATVAAGRPLVAPSAVGFSGQLAVYNLEGGPCYRDVFPPDGEPAGPVARGVMGPTPGILGTLAAMEVVQLLLGKESALGLTRRGQQMVLFDASDPNLPFQTLKVLRRPGSAGGAVTGASQPQAGATAGSGEDEGDIVAYITHDPLSLDSLMKSVSDTGCGGVVTFSGNTRDNFDGRGVVRLEYEAYESMAVAELRSIAREVLATTRARGVHKIACCHRLGVVPLGESSVLIAVASEHRAEGFEACRLMIDTLKARVPIWKKEIYSDGSAWKENKEWSNGSTSGLASKPEAVPVAAVQDTAQREATPLGDFGAAVRVLLFGPAREATGADHVDVKVGAGQASSLRDLRAALARDCPALKAILPCSRFSVGGRHIQEINENNTQVSSDVALIPPISGG